MSTDRATGLLFVIAGPSGAGKSSLVQGLVERVPGVEVSVSHTTRQARAGEREGREYHFVDEAAFRRLADGGRMLETARVFGNWYGTSRDWVGERRRLGADVLLEIDWQGAEQVRAKDVGAITVHVLPPSLEALERRLRARGQDGEASIAERVGAAGPRAVPLPGLRLPRRQRALRGGPRRAGRHRAGGARADRGAGKAHGRIPRPSDIGRIGSACLPSAAAAGHRNPNREPRPPGSPARFRRRLPGGEGGRRGRPLARAVRR